MRRSVSVAFMLLFLVSAVARSEECAMNEPAGNVITLAAVQSTTDTYMLKNPMTGKTVTPNSASIEWRTESEMMNGGTPSTTINGRFPLAVGYCSTVDGAASVAFPTSGVDSGKLIGAAALAVQYAPTEATNGQPFVRYLRIKWKENGSTDEKSATYRVVATSGAPDYASDARYKLWVYTGYTFLRSKNDFKDGYPELLLRAETRWTDYRIFMKSHDPDEYKRVVDTGCMHRKDELGNLIKDKTGGNACYSPSFFITRIYGEMGLTGTSVAANGGDTNTLGKIKQTFTAISGFGIGQTYLVSTLKDTDTSAFSLLGVARIGMITIPADTTAGTSGRGAFNYSINARVENEPGFRDGTTSGRFEGAYFEIGFGESEQFSRKKFPRLRVDSLLPIGAGTSLFRFAGRLQIDAPRPFHKAKTDPKDPPDNLANEVRISIVFNMDLLELAKRIGGK